MMNYNHRQLLTGALVTLWCLFAVCSPLPADDVKILALPYTKVEVVDVSKDSISFTTLSGKTISKPLADVRRVVIDDFPLFSAGEQLLYSGNHENAVSVYEEALEGLPRRQKKLLEKSVKLKKANKTAEAERCARRSKATWPKQLFTFRLKQAKKPPKPKGTWKKVERIKTQPPKTKVDLKKSTPGSCRICHGTKLIKCPGCNGSGYTKCPHIEGKKKHVKWHEVCKKCNGKGKLPKRYKKTYKTKTKWVTKYEPCPDCFEVLDQYGQKIYVTWVCPHCGNSKYRGYVKCEECNGTGKLKCEACGGTGLKNENSSPTPAVTTPKKPASKKK
jgi:hypothetical protein